MPSILDAWLSVKQSIQFRSSRKPENIIAPMFNKDQKERRIQQDVGRIKGDQEDQKYQEDQ
jgi:hypothetical protein